MSKKSDRIAALENEVSALKRDMELLKAAIASRPVKLAPFRYGPDPLAPPWVTTCNGVSGLPSLQTHISQFIREGNYD